MNSRIYRHHGKFRKILLSLALVLTMLTNSAVPAAADDGSGSVTTVASVVTSIGSTLENLFERFLTLFSGSGDDNADSSDVASGTDDVPTIAPVTVAEPQVAFGEIDEDNGTFTIVAINVPSGSAAAGYFDTDDVDPDDISVVFRVYYSDDPDEYTDYKGKESSDGSWTAECDMADFGFLCGSYSAAVLLESGNEEAQIAEGTGEVDLRNFLYAIVPQDGYGNAYICVVNPELEDGADATEVQFLLTLRKSQDDEEVSGTPNSGSVFTKLSVENNSSYNNTDDGTDSDSASAFNSAAETGTETIAVRKLSDTATYDTDKNSSFTDLSDISENASSETSGETWTDFLSTVDLTDDYGETVVDAEEISNGVWAATVSASSLDNGGTYTVEAYVGKSPDSVTESSDEETSSAGSEMYLNSTENPSDTGAVSIGTAAFTLWLRDSGRVEVPELLQNPELPTGCESVALTIALQSLGFDLDKTTIADDYLIHGTNFASSFVGDPYSTYGSGIFPPGLTKTANDYLKDQDSDYEATDISGTDFDDLLSYIDEGIPVLVWTTMYMGSVNFTGNNVTYRGKKYRWYSAEHCVVLCGYDRTNGTVLVSDPLVGIVSRDWDDFVNIYETAGEYAVVIE